MGNITRSTRKKACDPKVLLATDLEGCVFEPLGEIEWVERLTGGAYAKVFMFDTCRTFIQFEHFVFMSKGPQSEENALLKLWKAINRYNKTSKTEQRDSLAAAIHKTFIFEQSKLSVPIPNEMLKALDPDIPYDRPSTPAIKKLQQLAEENMDSLVEEFLQTKGEGCALLVPEDKERVKHSPKKVCGSS